MAFERRSWANRLAAAEQRGSFTSYEKTRLAPGWNTCAIGERHGWPESGASPNDAEELRLGIAFSSAVWNNNVPKAKEAYDKIQALPPVSS